MVNKDKDPYTEGIFEGVFANDQFMKERFENETYMCVVNEQDSQFLGSHSVMVYEDKKLSETLLEDTLPLWLQVQGTRLPSIQKITMFRLKKLSSIMDYFTWDCGFNDEFIYNCIKEKL